MSLAEVNAMLQKREELVGKARLIDKKATSENRALNESEQREFDGLMDEGDKLKDAADAMDRADRATAGRTARLERAEQELRSVRPHEMAHRVQPVTIPEDRKISAKAIELRNAILGRGPDVTVDFQCEKRAHQADNATAGGFLVQAEQYVAELIKSVDDMVFMLKICRTWDLAEATSMIAPSRDTRMNDADWTQELTAVTEDTAMTFGKRQIKPHPLTKEVKLSNTLLRLGSVPPEQLVRDELAYVFGITMEKGFLTGTGAGQPLGIFTASDMGVPTTRDISTDNTSTNITADGLWNAFYNLKRQYQDRAVTVGSRTLSRNTRKLKLGTGEYIWAPGLNSAQPDTMFGRPYYESEYTPSTFTTGLYVGCIFDPAAYWIARTLSLNVQVLRELYARTNQTGFIGRAEADAQPVIAEAFSRIKLA